jgi:hypothetical protein
LIPKDGHRERLTKKVWRGITGMNPKASFGNRFRSKLLGIIPPLRGIVQLINSIALLFRNWSFINEKWEIL